MKTNEDIALEKISTLVELIFLLDHYKYKQYQSYIETINNLAYQITNDESIKFVGGDLNDISFLKKVLSTTSLGRFVYVSVLQKYILGLRDNKKKYILDRLHISSRMTNMFMNMTSDIDRKSTLTDLKEAIDDTIKSVDKY